MSFKRNFYLIYKEILNNVIKHSKADRVLLTMATKQDNFILSIADNGIGFVETDILRGNGITNINRRAAQINGMIKLDSGPNQGTTIKLIFKIP